MRGASVRVPSLGREAQYLGSRQADRRPGEREEGLQYNTTRALDEVSQLATVLFT